MRVRKRAGKDLFADAAYDRLTLMDKAACLDCVVEIIRRDGAEGFEVPPRRRVAEHSFGSMTGWRRLVRVDKRRIDVSTMTSLVATCRNFAQRNSQDIKSIAYHVSIADELHNMAC